MTNLEEELKSLLLEYSEFKKQEYEKISESMTVDTSFDELGIPSLSKVEFVIDVEEHLDIIISDDDMENINTLKSLTQYLESTHNIYNN